MQQCTLTPLQIIRFLKGLLVLGCASLLSLAFLGNIFAYDINYVYLKNIMSMHEIPQHPYLNWRAVHNPFYFHVCYFVIIFLEGIISLLLWIGSYHLFKNFRKNASVFSQSTQWCQIGLLLSLVLYSVLFFMIGGEWFASWQSAHWNAKAASMPFIMLQGLIFLIISQKEEI